MSNWQKIYWQLALITALRDLGRTEYQGLNEWYESLR